jgi:hypothetical protein
MASAKKKINKVEITTSGSLAGRGQFEGKGTLTLSLSDAIKAGLRVETDAGKTKLTLSNAVGLKIRKSKTLKLTGTLSKELNQRGLEGKVGLSLNLPKGVDWSVSHEFKPGHNYTSMKLTVRF